VLQAQQRHDVQKRPKRALFEAYEAVFEENGLDTRQDRACLRIILQLGEPQIPGDLLYDKFEFVLRQIGVKLAFGDDDLANHNDQQAVAGPHEVGEAIQREALLQTSPKRPARRASFTSLHDITTEQIRQSVPRQLSRASESRLQDGRRPISMHRQKNVFSKKRLDTKPPGQRRFSHENQRSNRNGMNNAYSGQLYASSHQSPSKGKAQLGDDGRVYKEFDGDELSADREPEPSPRERYPSELFYQPSSTHLERDAEAFQGMRLRNLQRSLFSRWIRHTRQYSEHVQVLELQAVTKDFLTLKRQALDFWRTAHDQKRQQVREERFFEHLHNRAGQAYDLYLLTKSFTHWIQITAAVNGFSSPSTLMLGTSSLSQPSSRPNAKA
jgi:protein SFI1